MNRWELLSYCELLLDAASVGADYIDTCYTDIGVDGLARLDGEVGDGQTTGIDDADVSRMVQGRRDVEAMRMNGEEQVALAEVVARRVFIVTEGERRVAAVEDDRPCTLTSIAGSSDEVRTERYGCQAAIRCYVEAVAVGIHQVAFHLLAHVVRHEAVAVCRNCICIQLIVADSNRDVSNRDEADSLLAELCRSWCCRILGQSTHR